MNYDEAKRVAIANLIPQFTGMDDEPFIVDEYAIERPYGWVICWTSKRLVETQDPLFFVGGNGPIVIFHDGRVFYLGTACDTEEELSNFERRSGLSK